MTAVALIQQLWNYFPKAWDDEERAHVLKTIDFVRRTPTALERTHNTLGHVGASALVWNPQTRQVLLTVHTVTGERSFFGNHLDGSDNLPGKARERVAKETTLQFAESLIQKSEIFDVDVHYVPPHERHGEPVPAHLHYDMMYLFQAQTTDRVGLAQWFTVASVMAEVTNPQLRRLLTKLSKIG